MQIYLHKHTAGMKTAGMTAHVQTKALIISSRYMLHEN